MAPYTPPDAHYTQVDVSHMSDEDMKNFIGKGGYNFYKLTTKLQLDYRWTYAARYLAGRIVE